jgi:transcriptional regulator with XRE-family HTH domain
MLTMPSIGEHVAATRKSLGISQAALAKQAAIGRSTLDALENSRIGELGISKIIRLLSALGLELTIQEATKHRPTLDDLLGEERDDQSLDRRR